MVVCGEAGVYLWLQKIRYCSGIEVLSFLCGSEYYGKEISRSAQYAILRKSLRGRVIDRIRNWDKRKM